MKNVVIDSLVIALEMAFRSRVEEKSSTESGDAAINQLELKLQPIVRS
jgi:hypothetical protein